MRCFERNLLNETFFLLMHINSMIVRMQVLNWLETVLMLALAFDQTRLFNHATLVQMGSFYNFSESNYWPRLIAMRQHTLRICQKSTFSQKWDKNGICWRVSIEVQKVYFWGPKGPLFWVLSAPPPKKKMIPAMGLCQATAGSEYPIHSEILFYFSPDLVFLLYPYITYMGRIKARPYFSSTR